MMAERTAMGKAAMAFVAIIIVLAAGIGVASFKSQTTTSTPATTTGSSAPSGGNATSYVLSPNGLKLTLSASQTTVTQGSGVSIGVSLSNTLATRNNLSLPIGGTDLFSLGPCSQLPLGVAIF